MAVVGCNTRPAPVAVQPTQAVEDNSLTDSLKVQIVHLREEVGTLRKWWNTDFDHNLCSLEVCLAQLVEDVRVSRELGDHPAYEVAYRLSCALEAYRLSTRQLPRDVSALQGHINTLMNLVQNQIQEGKLAAERAEEGEKPTEDELFASLLDWLKKVKIGDPPSALPPRPGS